MLASCSELQIHNVTIGDIQISIKECGFGCIMNLNLDMVNPVSLVM